MKITYYGHSCFQIEENNTSIIFDPYADDSVPGLKLPENLHANAVYCSHQHADHNAASLIQIDPKQTWPVQTITVPHDDQNGQLRGFTNITKVNVNGTILVHMGDIGRMIEKEEISFLKDVNVLMIPAGGYYTINADIAKTIVDSLHPDVTILMHYRDQKIGYDVLEDIEDIISNSFPDCTRIPSFQYTLPKPSEQRIITLQPFQE